MKKKVMDWFKNLSIDNNNYRKRKVTNIQKYDKKNKKIKKIKTQEIEDTKKYPKNKLLKALVIIHENLYIPFDTIIIFSFRMTISFFFVRRVDKMPPRSDLYRVCVSLWSCHIMACTEESTVMVRRAERF